MNQRILWYSTLTCFKTCAAFLVSNWNSSSVVWWRTNIRGRPTWCTQICLCLSSQPQPRLLEPCISTDGLFWILSLALVWGISGEDINYHLHVWAQHRILVGRILYLKQLLEKQNTLLTHRRASLLLWTADADQNAKKSSYRHLRINSQQNFY